MNAIVVQRFAPLRKFLVISACVGAGVAVVLAGIVPNAAMPAYRCAVFACVAPALGSMMFLLLHRMTGGQWGDALEPFLIVGASLAPWLWLFVLPLAFAPLMPASDWPDYASRPMLAIRAALTALLLFFLAAKLRHRRTETAKWVGPVGLIALVFAQHLMADDWLIALVPHWHSTAFPLVWMSGQAVAGLACAILAALAAGISPDAPHAAPRALGLDWGNLLLAAMLVWCYLAFSQFLIIWAGNLPREIAWYEQRSRGAWAVVPPLLAVCHFVLPLAVLLSRSFKRSPRMLAVAAATLFSAQVVYTAWLILPSFPVAGWLAGVLVIVLLTAALSLLGLRYLAALQRRLETP